MDEHRWQRDDVALTVAGTPGAAWHYRPAGDPTTPRPVVVMAHGFAGVRALRLPAYAERFAAAGLHVLLFDHRGFGDSGGEPRGLLDIRRQHADWRAAIRLARTLPGVDPGRVVLWGTSLAGGHVLHLAARDPEVRAVVAQVPHVSGVAAALAVGPLTSLRLTSLALLDLALAAVGRGPVRVLAAAPPGRLAAMTSPDAVPGLAEMARQSGIAVPDQRVAARVVLQMALYSPGRRSVRRVQAPTLVQVATRDEITPPGATRRAARRLPRGEVTEHDLSHFEPYVEPHFAAVVAEQVAFLERVLAD